MSQTQFGPYQVVYPLGAGGMGEVYLVRHEETGQLWALKTHRAQRNSESWQRFINEGSLLREVNHPNVAAFHEMFLCGDRPCLVMEYVDGETLFDALRREGPFAVDRALAVLDQICQALEYLHERGIMHRDLKTANIKVDLKGCVKLLDFGIAKSRREPGITQYGARMGTPDYMSPEQLAGDRADAASEIWTLGVVAYELLTAQMPFRGADDLELYEAIRLRTPVAPSVVNPAVPRPVDQLVFRCLDKKASRRYSSPMAVRTAVREASSPAPEQRINVLEVAAAWWRGLRVRTRWILAVAALLLVLTPAFWPESGDMRTITVEVVEGRADVYRKVPGWDALRIPCGRASGIPSIWNCDARVMPIRPSALKSVSDRLTVLLCSHVEEPVR